MVSLYFLHGVMGAKEKETIPSNIRGNLFIIPSNK